MKQMQKLDLEVLPFLTSTIDLFYLTQLSFGLTSNNINLFSGKQLML